jgi:hypothetical protein
MRNHQPGDPGPAKQSGHRTWTAVVTVPGYALMAAAFSERDEHDDQIMQAAHEALNLMRKSGADSGRIDLFRDTEGLGTEWVEWRTVTVDERGLVVSANQLTDF